MKLFRYFLEEPADQGGGGIDSFIPKDNPDGQGNPQEPAEPQKPENNPAWTSQLPKETRENAEVMKRISGHKNIVDLVNALIASEDAGKDALHVPTKDSKPEEVKEFFKKLGVPEKASDYALSDYGLDSESIRKTKEIFMEAAHRSALSKRQAENMWMSQVALYKAVVQINDAEAEKRKAAFEPAYSKLLEAEYPEATERDKAMKSEMALVTKFAQELGIGKALAESGLANDAEAMHKLAGYVKSHTPDFIQGGKAPQKQPEHKGKFDNYSPQFLEAAGAR